MGVYLTKKGEEEYQKNRSKKDKILDWIISIIIIIAFFGLASVLFLAVLRSQS